MGSIAIVGTLKGWNGGLKLETSTIVSHSFKLHVVC